MKIKNSCWFVLLIIVLSCDGISHDRTTIILKGFENQKEIIYETPEAKIYIGYKDLIEYFENEGITDSKSKYSFFHFTNDSTYNQIIRYVKSFKESSIIISDTLGTKMIAEKEMMNNESNDLIRVRDYEHPYRQMSDAITSIIIEFAYNGKLKIFDKKSNLFVKKIIVDEVDTKSSTDDNIIYTFIDITLTDGTIIFSLPLGAKS